MDRVFINYRRDDAAAEAQHIRTALGDLLGKGNVFLDSERVKPGTDWPDRIRDALSEAPIVVVVIGPRWLKPNRKGKRRIDEESDWVRKEISEALANGKKVIPVLVRGATMPTEDDALPDDIVGLLEKQNIELRRDCWDHDVKRLTAEMGYGLRVLLREAGSIWNDASTPMRCVLALTTFLTFSSVASLSDAVVEWRGFILDGINFYRTYITSPLARVADELKLGPFTQRGLDVIVVVGLWVGTDLRGSYFLPGQRFFAVGLLVLTVVTFSGEDPDRLFVLFLILGVAAAWAFNGIVLLTRHRDEFLRRYLPALLAIVAVLFCGAINAGLSKPI